MSLPVTRRIARAALLVAAGAAPVVAAAGSASAAELPTKAPDLGGATSLDSANTNETIGNAAQAGAGLLTEVGTQAATTLAPALGKAAGPVMKQAVPASKQAADAATRAAKKSSKKGVSSDSLPVDAVQGLLGGLPAANGLIGGVPIGG